MAAKVALLSEDQRKTERVRRGVADYLVRQLLAIQVSKYLYQRVKIRESKEVMSAPAFPHYQSDEQSKSPRSAATKWEPPKHKRNLKAHPWNGIFVTR